MNININYGSDSISKTYPASPKVSDIIGDSNIKSVLGFGDNVKVLIDGVEQSPETVINSDCDLVIETKANQKAA